MNTEITYTRQGDYELPNLTLPKQDNREIGIWGQRRRRYLEQHHKFLYYNLLTSCKLHDHLADVNEEAIEMYDHLVRQLAEQEGVTERLKAQDQTEWVRRMNSITNRAREIVCSEIVYTA